MGWRCTITAACDFVHVAARHLAAVAWLSLAAVVAGCGATAPAPTPIEPPPPVTPVGPVVNMAGTWTGTFASANFPTQTMTLMAYQASNCVDGAWSSTSADWAGSISGYAGDASYSGLVVFERTAAGGGKCLASATITGPVIGNTIHWTADTLTPVGACIGGLPQSIVIDLQRQ
jgi:hypothetical protein